MAEAGRLVGPWKLRARQLNGLRASDLERTFDRLEAAESEAELRLQAVQAAAARFRPLSNSELKLFLACRAPGDDALVRSCLDLRSDERPAAALEAAWAGFAAALARAGKAAGLRKGLAARGILIDVCADGTPIVVRHFRAAPADTSATALMRRLSAAAEATPLEAGDAVAPIRNRAASAAPSLSGSALFKYTYVVLGHGLLPLQAAPRQTGGHSADIPSRPLGQGGAARGGGGEEQDGGI